MARGETRSRLREIVDEGVYRGSVPGTWTTLPVLLMAMVGLDHSWAIKASFLVVWLTSALIRIHVTRQALKHARVQPRFWRWLFRCSIWMTPFLWGPFTALTIYDAKEATWGGMLCLIVCAGFSGGGTAAFHADRVLHRGYVMGIWLPVMAGLMVSPIPGRTKAMMVLLIGVFIVYLLRVGGHQCKRHWKAVRDHLFTEQISHLSGLLLINQKVPVLLDCLAQSVRPLVDWETMGEGGHCIKLGSNPDQQVELWLNKPGGFTPDEIQIMQKFAAPVTGALDRLQLFQEVERMARYDVLTGVSNRRNFLEKAEEMIRTTRRLHQNTPLSFLLFDVDHFKSVNDTYGHDVGDQVLVQVAARAKKALREIDVLARYGGEEFVAMLPGANLDEAARLVGERLRKAMADEPFPTNSGDLHVTISIGVAELDIDEQRLEPVLKRADEAVYKAKKGGRNRVESSDDEPVVAQSGLPEAPASV